MSVIPDRLSGVFQAIDRSDAFVAYLDERATFRFGADISPLFTAAG